MSNCCKILKVVNDIFPARLLNHNLLMRKSCFQSLELGEKHVYTVNCKEMQMQEIEILITRSAWTAE